MSHPFLDLAPLTAERFASIEQRVAALLHTASDVVVMQGEALLPLEGCIRSAARPGATALNVVTGPYGQTFGGWLRDCGATVVDLEVPYDTAASRDLVAKALADHPETELVSLVHAEAATGNTNPVAEIGPLVREHGALLMVDAVASVAAEPLLTDAWGVDLCVIGAQKAMGGPAGVSAVSVSDRAWERISANPRAPRRSYLSLLDWKERWIDTGRTALPHAPAQLEMLALEACADRIEADGLDAVIARHRAASAATRAGVRAMNEQSDEGLRPYVHRDRDAAPAATTLRAPASVDARALVTTALAVSAPDGARPLPLAAGGGALAREMLRVNHYGPDASPATVVRCLTGLAAALRAAGLPADTDAATAAAETAWAASAG